MSHTTDIYQLLVQREGEWVLRDDLNFVGGEDTGRRMREVRDLVAHQGQYRLDEKTDDQRRIVFRLVRLNGVATDTERTKWQCVTCQSFPVAGTLGPSADTSDRWRIGQCAPCKNRRAIFARTGGVS